MSLATRDPHLVNAAKSWFDLLWHERESRDVTSRLLNQIRESWQARRNRRPWHFDQVRLIDQFLHEPEALANREIWVSLTCGEWDDDDPHLITLNEAKGPHKKSSLDCYEHWEVVKGGEICLDFYKNDDGSFEFIGIYRILEDSPHYSSSSTRTTITLCTRVPTRFHSRVGFKPISKKGRETEAREWEVLIRTVYGSMSKVQRKDFLYNGKRLSDLRRYV